METLKQNVGEGENKKKELAEFDATPRGELEALAKNLMTDAEQKELMNGELDLILRIARLSIERKEVPPSLHDAIAEATIIRVGAKEVFSRTFAMGPDGQIVGSGSNDTEAFRDARNERSN